MLNLVIGSQGVRPRTAKRQSLPVSTINKDSSCPPARKEFL